MSRLITVAIHTYEKAHQLKSILECEGVAVTLQNVNLDTPVVSSGIRVRIAEHDLPLALRVIENIEIFAPQALKACPEENAEVLVPVDFSPCSVNACTVAFHLAALHKAKIKLLHSFVNPAATTGAALQLTDAMTFDPLPDAVAEMEEDQELSEISKSRMKDLEATLREKIKDGVLPPVVFSSEITEGLPEEVVDSYASDHRPMLIVMGTRGAGKESRHLLGSVTAEVLDTCRCDIMTIPERLRASSIDALREVVYFCSSRQQDILALDALSRLLPESPLRITLLSIPTRKMPQGDVKAVEALLDYCRAHYPAYVFSTKSLTLKHEEEDFEGLDKDATVDLIVVPTPRRNIFTRLFNPTLAHRLLFHSDIAMLSIPV